MIIKYETKIHLKFTDEQLLLILYSFKTYRGRWPKGKDFHTPFRPNEVTFVKRFGSWKKAIEKAQEKYMGKY